MVMGDVGRSPRMQFHSLSLAKHGWWVDLVGYGGSEPHGTISSDKKIRLRQVSQPPAWFRQLPLLICFACRLVWQSVTLLLALLLSSRSDVYLVQNPPAIPAVFVCWLIARLKRSALIIDWHNYMHSILALELRQGHRLVKFSLAFETHFGRRADANFCVSRKMRDDLWSRWGIRAVTLHDRPGPQFRAINAEERHELFLKLGHDYPVFTDHNDPGLKVTRLSRRKTDQTVELLENRPAILISSTSWTADEDFEILLKALVDYDATVQNEWDAGVERLSWPRIIAVITGKGPMKNFYLNQIACLQLKFVEFCTPWLEAKDYPKLLAASDLGVCLHTSSSGLDLPMKVVDMFGSFLPVLAVNYNCIDELVRAGENGMLFRSSKELSTALLRCLKGFPNDCDTLKALRQNLCEFPLPPWQDCWDATVWPLIDDLVKKV